MAHLFRESDVLLRITHPANEIRSGYEPFPGLVDIIHDFLQFIRTKGDAKFQHCVFEFLAVEAT